MLQFLYRYEGMERMHPLAAYRAKRNQSPEQLAIDLGVAGLTVRRWEAGDVLPQPKARKKIHDVTGVRFAEFVAFVEARERAA